jgi:murein DD-endopeptidase MepM/ murein hydrolase activator NlpD
MESVSSIERSRGFSPVVMGVKPMGAPRRSDPRRRQPRYSSIGQAPCRTSDIAALKMTPVFFSAMIFIIAMAAGVLDSFIISGGEVGSIPFPGDTVSPVPVLKASVEAHEADFDIVELVSTRHLIERDETLSRIAYAYGLNPATLISINGLQGPKDIKTGRFLLVPYMDGIRITPRQDESVEDVARYYGTTADMVRRIPDSRDFFVSGGRVFEMAPSVLPRDVFLYPVSGRILTAFGEGVDGLTRIPYRSEGIDLSAEIGTPVRASRDGTVILTGQHPSYGLYAIMSHTGGWKSFYGHLNRVDVAPGDSLKSGTALGTVGSSGTARSPRLHFALIRGEESVDPLDYLY